MNEPWYNFLRQQGAIFEGNSVLKFGIGSSAYLDPNDTVFSPVNWMGIARISGVDAADFLQAQLTGDVGDIRFGTSGVTGYCNPKGRLLAIFRILRDGDDYLLLCDAGILPGILQRLQMYVLRMKVDLTVEIARVAIGLVGPNASHIVEGLMGDLAETGSEVFCSQNICCIPIGGQGNGYLVITPPGQLIESWSLIQNGARLAGTDQWTLFEMRLGLARITAATQEAFIPQSVNLDVVGGVSFSKGCYPGQEIVARVRYLGRLKHRMARAVIKNGGILTPGDPVFSDGKTTQRIGTVVNVVEIPGGKMELLATVPLGSSTGTEFPIDQTGRTIRLVEAPVETVEADLD